MWKMLVLLFQVLLLSSSIISLTGTVTDKKTSTRTSQTEGPFQNDNEDSMNDKKEKEEIEKREEQFNSEARNAPQNAKVSSLRCNTIL